MSRIKRLILSPLQLPITHTALAALGANHPIVFMLHRFRKDGETGSGHTEKILRSSLTHLRRFRRPILPVKELLEGALQGDRSVRRAVAFTIDDGYADFYRVAAPVFVEFDAPATVFLTTGFLDGMLWQWWDKVEYIIQNTTVGEDRQSQERGAVPRSTTELADRWFGVIDTVEQLKEFPEEEKLAAIGRMAGDLEIELPKTAPNEYAAMSWDQVRECASNGITFGPHTVTHCILSRTSDVQSRSEITESWKRVRAETTAHVPVFCYPNGNASSFTTREIDTLAQLGFEFAVTSIPGYPAAEVAGSTSSRSSFQMPRFPYPHSNLDFLQVVSGFEWLKDAARKRLR